MMSETNNHSEIFSIFDTNVQTVGKNNFFDKTNTMLMMVFIPLITTFATKITDNIIIFIGIIFEIIMCAIQFINKYINRKFITQKSHIIISLTSPHHDELTSDPFTIAEIAKPILWYISEKNIDVISHMKLISTSLDTDYDDDDDDDNNSEKARDTEPKWSKSQYSYVPIPDIPHTSLIDTIRNTSSKTNTHRIDNEDGLKSRKSIEINNNNDNMFILDKDVYVTMNQRIGKGLYGVECVNIDMVMISNRGTKFLQKYIENIYSEYDNYMKNSGSYIGKMFTYVSMSGMKPTYIENNFDKNQKFDNLFFSQKHTVINMVDKIKDIEYFKRTGIKRKISLLFNGKTGSGKTCCVNAIANYTNRAIIYVPISRITKNMEIERILYSRKYNDHIIPNDKKIILFDEIDTFTNINMKKNNRKKKCIDKKNIDGDGCGDGDNDNNDKIIDIECKIDTLANTMASVKPNINIINKKDDCIIDSKRDNTENDAFNIGMFLNLLDGINDQDGMIIIATSNECNRLDEALTRDGRMKLIEFENMSRKEIGEMIEKYTETIICAKQKNMIRDDKSIQNLTLKYACLNAIDDGYNLDEIIDIINKL